MSSNVKCHIIDLDFLSNDQNCNSIVLLSDVKCKCFPYTIAACKASIITLSHDLNLKS